MSLCLGLASALIREEFLIKSLGINRPKDHSIIFSRRGLWVSNTYIPRSPGLHLLLYTAHPRLRTSSKFLWNGWKFHHWFSTPSCCACMPNSVHTTLELASLLFMTTWTVAPGKFWFNGWKFHHWFSTPSCCACMLSSVHTNRELTPVKTTWTVCLH